MIARILNLNEMLSYEALKLCVYRMTEGCRLQSNRNPRVLSDEQETIREMLNERISMLLQAVFIEGNTYAFRILSRHMKSSVFLQ